MDSKQDYTQLPSSAEALEDVELEKQEWDEDLIQTQRPERRSWLTYFLVLLCGILLGVIIPTASRPLINSISRVIEKSHKEAPQVQHSVGVDTGFVISPETGEAKCGNSWQDAKRLGCHFDIMASRWYSDECYNGEVLSEMLKEVDFEWYADPQHTQPVSKDLALSGEFDELWPLYDYHIMHCLYLWRRLHSAVIGHRQLDDDVYSYGHTVHCTRLIMNWHKEKNTTTIQTSGIPFCRNDPL
ncbi:hypothetical protein F5884DRAFT_749713 [Xylogone sp. PMI_703]|nr:hypothetical protein F5884DRAFT_749713 [Xylogone sp. PMI_703]